jgi:hypothetical protein
MQFLLIATAENKTANMASILETLSKRVSATLKTSRGIAIEIQF